MDTESVARPCLANSEFEPASLDVLTKGLWLEIEFLWFQSLKQPS